MASGPELLRAAAAALDDGRIPLIVIPGVSLGQCFSLSQQLAIGARVVAAGIENPRSPQGIAMLMTMAESP